MKLISQLLKTNRLHKTRRLSTKESGKGWKRWKPFLALWSDNTFSEITLDNSCYVLKCWDLECSSPILWPAPDCGHSAHHRLTPTGSHAPTQLLKKISNSLYWHLKCLHLKDFCCHWNILWHHYSSCNTYFIFWRSDIWPVLV